MARFRATIQGQRGAASRLGGKDSGITATLSGWNLGVRVTAHADGDEDLFLVTMTGGSNNSAHDVSVGYVRLVNGTPRFEAAPGA